MGARHNGLYQQVIRDGKTTLDDKLAIMLRSSDIELKTLAAIAILEKGEKFYTEHIRVDYEYADGQWGDATLFLNTEKKFGIYTIPWDDDNEDYLSDPLVTIHRLSPEQISHPVWYNWNRTTIIEI